MQLERYIRSCHSATLIPFPLLSLVAVLLWTLLCASSDMNGREPAGVGLLNEPAELGVLEVHREESIETVDLDLGEALAQSS